MGEKGWQQELNVDVVNDVVVAPNVINDVEITPNVTNDVVAVLHVGGVILVILDVGRSQISEVFKDVFRQ